VRCRLSLNNRAKREAQDECIDKLLQDGIIEPVGISEWASPPLFVPKKSTKNGKKEYRLVVDYRALNKRSWVCHYQMPRTDAIFAQLGKGK
jgi:hypothetical protein